MGSSIDIPFTLGQSEKVDPKLAGILPPGGLFTRVENIRWRKDGRAAKRFGARRYTLTSLGAVSGLISALMSWRGNRAVIADGVLNVENGTSVWPALNDVSRFLPIAKRTVAVRENKTALRFPSVCFFNGYWWHAYDDGTDTYVVVTTTLGAVANSNVTTTFAGRVKPRWVVDSAPRLIYQLGGGTTILARPFNATTLAPGGESSVVTLGASSSGWDAATFSSSQWLLAYRDSTNLIANIVTGSTVTSTQPTAGTGANVTPTIFGTPGERVYMAWNDATTIRIRSYDAAILGSASAVQTVETDSTNLDCPSMVRENSTSVRLVWGGYDTSSNSGGRTAHANVTNAVVVGTINEIHNFRPYSRPINVGGRVFVWCSTDNRANQNAGWETHRTFWLVTLDGTREGAAQLHGWPLVSSTLAATMQRMVDVVSSGSAWLVPFESELRKDATGVTVGIETIAFSDYTMGVPAQRRQVIEVNGALHVLAGAVTEYDGGDTTYPNCTVHPPAQTNTATIGAGGSVDVGTHLYRFVFEKIDNLGRRHRSAPSDPISATTTGGNQTVISRVSRIGIGTGVNSSNMAYVIHGYRTKVNGTVFYRFTPAAGAAIAIGGRTTTITDTVSDAAIAVNEILYTDGGVQPNFTAPACRFGCVHNNRMVLGGLLLSDRAIVSKAIVSVEPVQFTKHEAFQVVFPGDLTGLASQDGALLGFTQQGVYIVNGDGPDDRGLGAGFSEPQQLIGAPGCVNERSVFTSPVGTFYEAARGLYLIPRGFGTPLFVGEKVRSTLATFPMLVDVMRATKASSGASSLGEDTIRFLLVDSATAPTAARVLVFDVQTGEWTVDTPPVVYGSMGTWLDEVAYGRLSISDQHPIRTEDTGLFGDTTGLNSESFVPSLFETGDLRPFGMQGRGMVRGLLLLGEYRAACTVTLEMSLDSGQSFPYTASWPLSGLAAGDRVALRWDLPVRYLSELRVRARDSNGSANEGFVFNGITLDNVDKLPGSRALGASFRSS